MIKLDMKNNFGDWEKAMAKIRKEFPKEIEDAVEKHTHKISRGAKASAPIKHSAIKNRTYTKIRGMTGDVIVPVYYAPYPEYGTGAKVNVPSELTEYAKQFKGKGIRQVNIDPRPYLYPHFFIQRFRFMETLKEKLRTVSKRAMIKRRGGALKR